MAGERVREYARKHPEAFRKVATARDDDLKQHLLEVLEEENSQQD